jgi:hypothetical protein
VSSHPTACEHIEETTIRICLVDTLNERHVAYSLARALAARGHDARTTGPIWHGWRLPNAPDERARLAAVVDGIVDQRPDVVLAIRSAALRPEQVDRLRKSGIFTIAWFADDPVLYKAQTARVARHYDLTLHTATAPVLTMYESELGVRGVTFPFWADVVEFPRSYDPLACDLDLVFIGNTQTRVKLWRYDWIAGLPVSRAIYGEVADDPAGIHAGVADDVSELVRACLRGRLGLNISQRFTDYAGTRFDFPGLAEFGEFLLPSRIVQLAAVGVPVVSLAGSEEAAKSIGRLFPPVLTVRSQDELVALTHLVRDDRHRLLELSELMHRWYARYYTADARARFLEHLISNPERWTKLTAIERADAFLKVPTPSSGPINHLIMARNRVRRAVRLWRDRAARSEQPHGPPTAGQRSRSDTVPPP